MGNFYLSCFEIANPIYTIIRFGLQECGDFTWRVSDCEELVGVTWIPSDCEELSGGYSQEMMGLVLKGISD